MSDAETIASLQAEVEQLKKIHWSIFDENRKLQMEVNRLSSMRSVLWQLMELTEQVRDSKKKD